jgi:hypothetical protein
MAKQVVKHMTEHTYPHADRILILVLLMLILSLQVVLLYRSPSNVIPSDVHTAVLNWSPQQIGANAMVSGYVGSWAWSMDVSIVAVQVWMGNPNGILWKGDVYVTLNNRGIFNNSTDQVLVHYQLDKHAESSTPHQLMFQIGSDGSGFPVKAGQTIWIWRAFNNISDHSTTAGDGQVIIYYQEK